MNCYKIIRPALFALDPEFSHDLAFTLLKWLQKLAKLPKTALAPMAPVECFGLTFPNPIGLAAGLDKNGECIPIWQALGFGFIEVGTVTPRPQTGNDKPRLFRLTEDCALINRMGFNNKGVEYLIEKIEAAPRLCPLGVNIGKNKDTPLEKASEDYLICFRKVAPFADYITVNVSSPNTPGLRSLQTTELLHSLLNPLLIEQQKYAMQQGKQIPILVKLAPDLTPAELEKLACLLVELKVSGVIITNTTLARPPSLKSKYAKEEGGLSGAPLCEWAAQVVRIIYKEVGEALPIVGVGGIMNADDAIGRLRAGAKLIQLYSGLIYQGPQLIEDIAAKLAIFKLPKT